MSTQEGNEPGIYTGDMPGLQIHHTRTALGIEPGVMEITEGGLLKMLRISDEHSQDLRGIERLLRTGISSGVDRFTADESLHTLNTWLTEHAEADDEVVCALGGVRDVVDRIARRTAREQVRHYGSLIHELDGSILAVTHADSEDIYGVTASKGNFNVARLRGLLVTETAEKLEALAVVERTIEGLGVINKLGGMVCLIETSTTFE